MRFLLLLILSFTCGFLLRDYTGPVKLPISFHTVKQAVKPEKLPDNIPGNVEIAYKDGKFSPAEAVVPQGRYLTIINRSDSLMWLSSDNPLLSTPRGYANLEQVRVRLDEPGSYTVENKLNIEAKATISVVP